MTNEEPDDASDLNDASDFIADTFWLLLACVGGIIAVFVPGGMYVLVVPAFLHAIAVWIEPPWLRRQAGIHSVAGWLGLVAIVGEVMVLLAWALGVQYLWLYSLLGGGMGGAAMMVSRSAMAPPPIATAAD